MFNLKPLEELEKYKATEAMQAKAKAKDKATIHRE